MEDQRSLSLREAVNNDNEHVISNGLHSKISVNISGIWN